MRWRCPSRAPAQPPDLQTLAAQIVKSDADFAQSVAEKNRERFLSVLADQTTFAGGMPNEIHGRDAVMQRWSQFFMPDGPTLTWAPIKGEVFGAGDFGYTTGRSVFRERGPDGKIVEIHSQYITVWGKQTDGSWKVIFDTGGTIP